MMASQPWRWPRRRSPPKAGFALVVGAEHEAHRARARYGGCKDALGQLLGVLLVLGERNHLGAREHLALARRLVFGHCGKERDARPDQRAYSTPATTPFGDLRAVGGNEDVLVHE